MSYNPPAYLAERYLLILVGLEIVPFHGVWYEDAQMITLRYHPQSPFYRKEDTDG